MRVASLLAAGTEIVCALGCQDQLIARSHECDFPATVQALPVCTEALIDATQSSAAIDRQVKTAARDALSIYRVDREMLRVLQPDVIITQTQCEVCAVSLRDVEAAVCDLLDQSARIVSLEPHALADIWRDIARVAAALGLPDEATATIGALQARLDALAALTSRWPAPTVACIEWI